MSSSPKFWQKLGLGKQNKSSPSSTVNSVVEKQDSLSIHSTISFHNVHDATLLDNNSNYNNDKQLKRFSSNMSLRHRASSASLRQQVTQQPSNIPEKQIRRTSYMKPLRRIDPEESISTCIKLNENIINTTSSANVDQDYGNNKKERAVSSSSGRISADFLQQQRKVSIAALPQLQYQQPLRKQSMIDLSSASNTMTTPQRLPPRLKRTKSNQSLKSTSTTTSIGSGSRPSVEYYQQQQQQQQQQKSAASNNTMVTNNGGSRLRQPSPAISHAKLLSRSGSNNSLNSAIVMQKKKSLPKLTQSSSGDDDNADAKSCMTRSSSNGSNSTAGKRKSSMEKRRSKQVMNDQPAVPTTDGDFVIDMLKDELEREKASARSLQGQKEAIAKDLDYFCNLVDEVTEEKDDYKRKYEQEKLQNEELKKSLEKLENKVTRVSPKGASTASQLKLELEAVQQQATEDQYVYYNNLQFKNDEINKLKYDLKQAQRQIQVLRKTMEQMLRADGKDFDDDFNFGDEEIHRRKSNSVIFDGNNNNEAGGEKYLLLQSGYHPDHQSTSSASSNNTTTRPTTNPPSPTPCYSNTTITEEPHTMSGHDDEDEDLYSITSSKESYHSNYRPLRHHSQQYEFLKYDNNDDNHISSLAKRKSADFSKKIAMSRRRKDQLEEMLGEVDSQLNKVKQKIRPT